MVVHSGSDEQRYCGRLGDSAVPVQAQQVMTMDGQLIVRFVGYITAGVVLVAGILIISGYIVPSYVPANFRIIAGVVLILYGLYRPAMIYLKSKKAHRAEE